MDGITGLSSLTQSSTLLQSTKMQEDNSKFDDLVKAVQKKYSNQNENRSNISSNQIVKDGKLNGDISSSFANKSSVSVASKPQGAAANSAPIHQKENVTIDKTSKLYEKSLELESFFVKIMVNSMRKTVSKASGENSFAQNMYDDMIYDEYTNSLTKNAGFGLADQIYQQLSIVS